MVYNYKDTADGARTITAKNAGNYILDGLQRLREHRTMCDVIFKVQGQEVFAHRVILVIHSEYFHAMFADGFNERQTRDIFLPAESAVDSQSAETLVSFMYSGRMTVTSQNVQGLIMAADHWQMVEAKQMCVNYMERLIDTENCLGMLNFAETYLCEKLRLKCIQVIKQHFPVVVQSTEFLHLSRLRLEEVLAFTDLNLGHNGEDVVLKAVMRWFSHNSEQRLPDLLSVLRHVRLSQTSRECRKQHLDSCEILQESEDVQQVIGQLLIQPTEVRTAQASLYVIGGFLQSRTGPVCPRLNSVERLDPVTGHWTDCATLPMKASGSFSFTVFGHLFCAAFQPIDIGHAIAANLALETAIYEYNFVRDEWTSARGNFSPEALESIDNCLQAEGALAVCAKTSTIYTVSNREISALTVNLINGAVSCRAVTLLPRPRGSTGPLMTDRHRLHAACILDTRLYVLGGDRHDAGSEPVPSGRLFMFDRHYNRWEERATMTETRAALGVAVMGGFIYACGGFNVRRLDTIERYDPATNSWTSLQPMSKFRSHHQLLALQNRLWAIGGKSYAVANGGARKVLNLCEVYDPSTDSWSEGVAMRYARCGFSAVAV